MSETNQPDEKLVGIELSASNLKAVCLQADGNLLDSQTVFLNRNEEIFPQLINFINQLKSQHKDFKKIGIAVPGLVNHLTNRIAFSTHIPEQTEVDFVNQINEQTGLITIVENDANAAAYGEYLLGAGRGSRDIFYVTLGIGVGGAIIVNGNIWRGTSGYAGEFGYMTLNSEGIKLEEVASASNIIRRIKNRFHQDQTSSLVEIGEENITIADVVREANNGDNFAQMMLERTGMFVGTGVASVINLLNIEKIIVGGEVMGAESFVLDAIIERAGELSFAPSFETTQIVAGELKDLAAPIGVALITGKKN
ncbi:MAG: ROK family protein [Blastocatellia bacterium]|nr:ROK family protein [Blastocatellia bacterium]